MSRFLILSAILLAACRPDDDKDDTGDGGGGGGGGDDTPSIVGDWLSEGDNLAPLFVDYTDYVSISASFNSDGTYQVEAAYKDSTPDELSGTYSVVAGDPIGTIVLSQSSPTTVTSEGIWQVEGDTLTYEVLQTDPDTTGCTPPTVDAGFGSTECSYLDAGDNVQIYVRQ